jgi:hypothetical protein
MTFSKATAWTAAAMLACLSAFPALGQEAAAGGGKIVLQLNNAKTQPATEGAQARPVSCQLIFAMKNDTGVDTPASTFNMAIIDANGQATGVVGFGFKPLKNGETKFTQFVLSDQTCEDISGVLINEIVECVGDAVASNPVCTADIAQSSKTSIQFPWELQ